MDRLDLLGVKYDVEMEIKAKYELAEELYKFWSKKCGKFDDFKNNCLISICYELRTNDIEKISEVWKIIENKLFENYNLIDIENNENRMLIKAKGDSYIYDVVFNEIWENEWYTIIDKQKLGYKLVNDIREMTYIEKDEFKDEILTKIEEDYINKIRNEICGFVFEDLGVDIDEY